MITVEELKQHRQVELARICKEWAKQNLDNSWQHYAGWAFSRDGCIGIKYSYNDIINNIEYETCYGTKLVTFKSKCKISKGVD